MSKWRKLKQSTKSRPPCKYGLIVRKETGEPIMTVSETRAEEVIKILKNLRYNNYYG